LAEVEAGLAFNQPNLSISECDDAIIAEGEYLVTEGPHADGPIARYQICILFSKRYPFEEPLVLETAGDIERIEDLHMYSNGCCCTCVWEEWLATSRDRSVRAFCEGPLRNFFLGQVCFAQTGKWPFGERAHGIDGVVEAANAILGLELDEDGVRRYLSALAANDVKGHWECPCGSGEKLRHCCCVEIAKLQARIDRRIAAGLRSRLVRLAKQER
jgi:hypothetical protein